MARTPLAHRPVSWSRFGKGRGGGRAEDAAAADVPGGRGREKVRAIYAVEGDDLEKVLEVDLEAAKPASWPASDGK